MAVLRWIVPTWLCGAIALTLTTMLLSGIHVDWQPFTFTGMALVWGVLHLATAALLRLAPALPFIAFAVARVALDALCLVAVDAVVDDLVIDDAWSTVLAAVLISVLVGPLLWWWQTTDERFSAVDAG